MEERKERENEREREHVCVRERERKREGERKKLGQKVCVHDLFVVCVVIAINTQKRLVHPQKRLVCTEKRQTSVKVIIHATMRELPSRN